MFQDPVKAQYTRSDAEDLILPEELADPIGDHAHTPVKGVVHRHRDRVLLKISNICADYCRYCFRKEMIGPGSEGLKNSELDAALEYIRTHEEIWEVILTGGDPLMWSAEKLSALLDALEEIAHVRVVRIHTRAVISKPSMMSAALEKALTRDTPLYIALHINHPAELSEDVRAVVRALGRTGAVLLSQSVLLNGINNDVDVLEALYREFVALKIKPYYLHHPDYAPGTSHFRLPLAEGMALMAQLQGRLSGIAVPSYMLDIPGGYGKVPVNDTYICALGDGVYSVRDMQGRTHLYPPRAAIVTGKEAA